MADTQFYVGVKTGWNQGFLLDTWRLCGVKYFTEGQKTL